MTQRQIYEKGGVTRWYWDYRDRQVLKEVPHVPRIVDVGCGEGITTEKIRLKYPDCNVYGMDVNIKDGEKWNYLRDDITSSWIGEKEVNCVLMLDVLEHIESWWIALMNVRRILKPGGTFIILFPNDLNFKLARIMCGKFKEAFAPAGHVNQFNPKMLTRILRENRFEIEKVRYLPFGIPYPFNLHTLIVARKT